MTTNAERAAEVIQEFTGPGALRKNSARAIAQALADAAPAPELLEALIAEKRAHQELRDRIGRLRDWHNERGELMCNLYEESLDREFKDKSDSHSFTANQLSAILDPRGEEQGQKVARTLADMTPDERQASIGMWCDNLASTAKEPRPVVLACVQGGLCWILHTDLYGEWSCFSQESLVPRLDLMRAWNPDGTPPALSG